MISVCLPLFQVLQPFNPMRACEAGMIFTLGAQRTFCRDHKPNSQEVNWLWVLEAEFSLALVGGCLGLRPGREMYNKQEYFLLNHLLRYWYPMCDLLRSCSGACLKYRMPVSTPSLLYQLPGSGAPDSAFSTGQFTDILKSLVLERSRRDGKNTEKNCSKRF